MRKIKLLHVVPSLVVGGAELLVVEIIKRINREVFDIALCVLFPPCGTVLEDELRKMEIEVFYLGKHLGADLRMFSRVGSTLRAFKPDIIHTHNYVMRYTLWPTLFSRIPIRIHTVHNIAAREVDSFGMAVHWVAFKAFRSVPVSISASVAESVKTTYGTCSPMIYNGIPVDCFSKRSHINKKRKSGTTFISVGNFRPQKNHRLLVAAFTKALAADNNIRLLLVGEGPIRGDIEAMVRDKNLGGKISFLGHRNDIPNLLSQSDILISSSEWEGFGLSIVEAMAAGKPVIATAVDGVPELVKDEVTGLLVPNKDADALASAILRLAADHRLIRRMGHAGRIKAVRDFDISRTTRHYEQLYLRLLKAA